MSNFMAIAGVSSTLRNLLRDRMEQSVDVTIAPPDVTVTGTNNRRLNLYLYHVNENAFLRNQEIPGQGSPGAYGFPPLSLDLHYLVTAFAANEVSPDADLQAQQVLGDAMRVLHDFSLITDTLHEQDNPVAPLIFDPSLVGEFERIKITLQPTSLEDFAKIWTALPQANFRRSVAYQVSVVQIESRRPRRPSLPVRKRQVHVLPLHAPVISEIRRDPPLAALPGAAAEPGDTLLILGRNLSGEGVSVRLGTELVAIANPQDSRITVTVPATLAAGVHSVQVVRQLLLEAQPGTFVPHGGFESNAVPLLVIPRLISLAPPGASAGTLVTATVDPPALACQRKSLLLGDREIQAEPAAPESPPSVTVSFRLPSGPAAIPAGTYLVRVRIDGAESQLTTNPVTGQYDGPTFTVT